eukprot:TRINITY_DN12645_c0_g1_i1.p1 TRINITY_DN12645_c0_g1~~TRINITY_DN12645_c0_g1_i1.p1  ORF type:complete len:212 (+),score=40.34 TRINITY_DN12645_c0_g1_i1:124-759(+)
MEYQQSQESIVLSMKHVNGILKMDPGYSDYSSKIQHFISEERFEGVVDQTNEIHQMYGRQFIVATAVFFAISTALSLAIFIIAIDPYLYFYALAVILTLLAFDVGWYSIVVQKRERYRRKEMAKCCNDWNKEFPGTNWLYGETARTQTHFASRHIDVRFPTNPSMIVNGHDHLMMLPMTTTPVGNEPTYLPPKATNQDAPLLGSNDVKALV